MYKCDDMCEPICDFCLYFTNGNDLNREDIEEGYCSKYKKDTNLTSYCDEYCCYTVGYRANFFLWLKYKIKLKIKNISYLIRNRKD